MSLDPTAIKDLVTGTLDIFWPKEGGPGSGGYIQIAQTLQQLPFFGLLMQENRLSVDGGMGITTTLMDKSADTAEWVGFFEGGTLKFTDVFFQISVDYKWLRDSWVYDIKEKFLQSRDASKIADVIQARDESCTIGLVEKLEKKAWSVPDSSLTKEMHPIPLWIVWNSATEGFTGKYPNGFTDLAGADLDKHPNFQNYSRIYTDPTRDDLLREMRFTHMKTNFKSPIDQNAFRGVQGLDFRIFTNDQGMVDLWEINEDRKDTLAWDIAMQDNQTTFKGNQIVYVPALDSDNVTLTSSSGADMGTMFYFINRKTFHVIVLEQDFMRRSEPMNDQLTPDVYANWKILAVQTMCSNRRSNGIVAKAA